MFRQINILYIHGMGGGGDSRIPSVLNCLLNDYVDPARLHFSVHVRTYDFDPEVAGEMIAGWVEEIRPQLVIGESLGACHAIAIKGVPHILVSPSLGGPVWLYRAGWLTLIPGGHALAGRIWRPREGDRQKLDFSYGKLRKYGDYLTRALDNSPRRGSRDYFHAFFGEKDHYRKSGVVSVRLWRRYFGDTYTMYGGTHFMEEEFIESLLIPKILEVIG